MTEQNKARLEAIRAEIIKLKLEAPYTPKIVKLQQEMDRLSRPSETA
tara:strand:- start:37 stop:177 length:141 start_codon:yes stop_codon:yes gene_type:complete